MLNIFSSAARIRSKAQKHLKQYNRPTIEFFVLTALASSIISIGLILNNAPIIIGGMVVAPLISPFFGFSLNIILLRLKGIFLTLLSILSGGLLAILTSALTGHLIIITNNKEFITTVEIIARTEPNILYFVVAILSGIVGTYAYVKPTLSEKIVGIAISASIIPPLSVIGLGLSKFDWTLITKSSILFLLNFLGICLGSIIMFLILGFGKETEPSLE